MADHYFNLCTLLTLSLSFHGISAVDYQVTNCVADTPGGIRFNNEIGIPFTKQLMGTVNDFIWTTVFQQNNPDDRKPVDTVNLYIVELEVDEGVTWGNNNINISSSFLQGYQGDLKFAYTALLYHEMTHVFQWNGEGQTPAGLVEGVAEYTTLRANYISPAFAKPGDGSTWDQGYDFTARFLEYCDGIVPGFVAKLNAKMRFAYDVKYFEELTGKPVDQLWQEYKAKYGH
ncbi:hypothetical protein L2E82_36968 [Cichorium intybus]|uniref:Uncharacterized protein n=1 Tax=Cichorium intybus TaxID=13427 RepID=A0ACB9AEB6_CICIN|nr:hypothetical protein L2E82_36968 [Cichorium intybus]